MLKARAEVEVACERYYAAQHFAAVFFFLFLPLSMFTRNPYGSGGDDSATARLTKPARDQTAENPDNCLQKHEATFSACMPFDLAENATVLWSNFPFQNP